MLDPQIGFFLNTDPPTTTTLFSYVPHLAHCLPPHLNCCDLIHQRQSYSGSKCILKRVLALIDREISHNCPVQPSWDTACFHTLSGPYANSKTVQIFSQQMWGVSEFGDVLIFFIQIPWNSAGVEGLMSPSGRPFSGLSRDVWSGSGHGRHSQSSLRHSCLVLAVFLGLLSGWKGSWSSVWALRIQVSLTADQPPRPSSWNAPPPRSLRGGGTARFSSKNNTWN